MYQKINIKNVQIDGIDREKDYKICFPDAPVGMTILDIGCNTGFYCLKASDQGATYCLGIDNHQPFLDIAIDAKNKLGFTNIDFINNDVLKMDIKNKFDIILCLNLVHHFKNITDVNYLVKKLYKHTKKQLIFEILECKDKEWSIIENRIKNKKIHLSKTYFERLFPACIISSTKSKVTKGRIFIHIEKGVL